MIKKVGVLIDDDLDKKLRVRQGKLISQEQTAYSYSQVINDILRKAFN